MVCLHLSYRCINSLVCFKKGDSYNIVLVCKSKSAIEGVSFLASYFLLKSFTLKRIFLQRIWTCDPGEFQSIFDSIYSNCCLQNYSLMGRLAEPAILVTGCIVVDVRLRTLYMCRLQWDVERTLSLYHFNISRGFWCFQSYFIFCGSNYH